MDTVLEPNAPTSLCSPHASPTTILVPNTPTTLREPDPSPPNLFSTHLQELKTVGSSFELPPGCHYLNFRPMQTEKFSDTCHRPTPHLNRKRGVPTSLDSPLSYAKLQRVANEPSLGLGYKELILKARELLIQASLATPSSDEQSKILDLLEIFREYTEKGKVASFSKIISSQVSNLESATRKIEKIARTPSKATPPLPTTQSNQIPFQKIPSLAQIASQGPPLTTTTLQEWKLVQNKTSKPPQASQKLLKVCKRLILVQSSTGSSSQFSPFALRNAFNKAFLEKGVKGPVVNTISRTQSSNIVVTTTSSFSADYLLEKKEIWQAILPFKSAQKDESWHKVAIHGIPTRDFDIPSGMQLVVDEITTFNQGFKPIGTPYWLTTQEKRKNQLAGLIVVAFAIEEETKRAIRHRLYIGGISIRVEKLYSVAPTTQCGKCQGYGHLDSHCRKSLRCRLCAENHATPQHACSSCPTKGARCPHLAPKCSNCKGAHTANSEVCEILLAIKSKAL